MSKSEQKRKNVMEGKPMIDDLQADYEAQLRESDERLIELNKCRAKLELANAKYDKLEEAKVLVNDENLELRLKLDKATDELFELRKEYTLVVPELTRRLRVEEDKLDEANAFIKELEEAWKTLEDECNGYSDKLDVAVEALENNYKILSPYMPCEDMWEDDDPYVMSVRNSEQALKKIKAVTTKVDDKEQKDHTGVDE